MTELEQEMLKTLHGVKNYLSLLGIATTPGTDREALRKVNLMIKKVESQSRNEYPFPKKETNPLEVLL